LSVSYSIDSDSDIGCRSDILSAGFNYLHQTTQIDININENKGENKEETYAKNY